MCVGIRWVGVRCLGVRCVGVWVWVCCMWVCSHTEGAHVLKVVAMWLGMFPLQSPRVPTLHPHHFLLHLPLNAGTRYQ